MKSGLSGHGRTAFRPVNKLCCEAKPRGGWAMARALYVAAGTAAHLIGLRPNSKSAFAAYWEQLYRARTTHDQWDLDGFVGDLPAPQLGPGLTEELDGEITGCSSNQLNNGKSPDRTGFPV
ncbi:hypothetical protein NDU88_001767 [Pleurodeles waltl]|uniref:Uncharacterized protein n=1 Tax=Pleurodeles waltl TaxID=8319 RepID=A0AAV7U8W0_PLEWA|nr:hypothetical protein NDU88_001767 [Pleurodeles waltl]